MEWRQISIWYTQPHKQVFPNGINLSWNSIFLKSRSLDWSMFSSSQLITSESNVPQVNWSETKNKGFEKGEEKNEWITLKYGSR